MSQPVIALVIGVSNYLCQDFTRLPAAQSDASKLARFLLEMGLPESSIFLLNSHYVTSEQFTKCVDHFSSFDTPFQLLFYFCGHGYRTVGQTPQSHLIFSDTEIAQNACTGVSLETLLQMFNKLRANGIYLFLDACSLRLNSLANPKNTALFSLLSSGISPSFESAEHQYGYFTEALIKALRTSVHSDRSPESLYKFIQKELRKNALPIPEMYNIGTHTIDFFPHNKRGVEKSLNKALAALFSCGMVIDEVLFHKVFGLPESAIKELEQLGFIYFENGAWHPHDTLNRIVEREKIEIDPEATKSYWLQQFQELPDHYEAAHHLVMTIQCFGFDPKYDKALQAAYRILSSSKAQAVETLKASIAIYPKGPLPNSALSLAEILIEKQQCDLAKALLNSQKCAARCHLLWRSAHFKECIDEATEQIASSQALQAKIPYYWHRATAYYLLGDWNQALSDFGFIERHSNHPLYIGRSLCLLGTVTGIRGIQMEESQARIETGIRMLMKNGDQSGSWVGWNNIGEIMWKAGNWKLSQHHLKKALDVSQGLENHNMILETLRNFVQLELKSPHGSRAAIQTLLEQIEGLLAKPIEIFEEMQIYNTLCIAYLALDNLTRAQFYLNKAIPITVLSQEYHIYTLSNLAAICQKNGLKEKSDRYFQRALALAKEGNNLFAIQQIQKDFRA